MSRSASLRWHKSLAVGDLAIGSTMRSHRYHVVRVSRSKHHQYGEAGVDWRGEKAEDGWWFLWNAAALCGGSGGGYYWRLEHQWDGDDSPSARCPRCFARWRALGQPTIRGWNEDDGKDDPSADWPLPFGWAEVAVAGHPYDVPPGGDVSAVLDADGDVVGERRTELRRWQRGFRVVRVVELHRPDNVPDEQHATHATRYHDAHRPKGETWNLQSSLAECIKDAWKLMALGGRS